MPLWPQCGSGNGSHSEVLEEGMPRRARELGICLWALDRSVQMVSSPTWSPRIPGPVRFPGWWVFHRSHRPGGRHMVSSLWGVNRRRPGVADVTNEKVVIGKGLFDCNGPNLFADGDNHKAVCWGSGLPMGLPRHWLMHFWPNANVCMSKADLIKCGTSFTMIFRVTLRPRNVRPLIMSPGLLLVLPG